MVKQNRSDIDMLLSALLVCSVLIGGFHHWSLDAEQKAGVKKSPIKKLDTFDNPLATSSVNKILDVIQPFIISESVEKLVQDITNLPVDKMIQVLKEILNNKQQFLNRDDRVKILFGAAVAYKDTKDREHILDLMTNPDYRYLTEGNPILYLAADTDYAALIPSIKEWYGKQVAKQANGAKLRDELEMTALAYAVKKKNLDALKTMKQYGVAMLKERMGILLNDAVRMQVGCPIIGFLLAEGADINYAVDGYTPLLHAIQNKDIDAVQLLVKHGADTNKLVNIDVGNPRQLARSVLTEAFQAQKKISDKKTVQAVNNAISIEAYLIDHGAQD